MNAIPTRSRPTTSLIVSNLKRISKMLTLPSPVKFLQTPMNICIIRCQSGQLTWNLNYCKKLI